VLVVNFKSLKLRCSTRSPFVLPMSPFMLMTLLTGCSRRVWSPKTAHHEMMVAYYTKSGWSSTFFNLCLFLYCTSLDKSLRLFCMIYIYLRKLSYKYNVDSVLFDITELIFYVILWPLIVHIKMKSSKALP